MNRLTFRSNGKAAYIDAKILIKHNLMSRFRMNEDYENLINELAEYIAAYEDTGLDPEEITKLNDFEHSQLAKVLSELQAYQRLEEQGLLIKLPCKVGDIVYKLEDYGDSEYLNKHIFIPIKCEVDLIFLGYDNKVYCNLANIDEIYGICNEAIEEVPINEIFLTKEESEKALEVQE